MRTSQLFRKEMREAVADEGRIQSPAAAPSISLSFSGGYFHSHNDRFHVCRIAELRDRSQGHHRRVKMWIATVEHDDIVPLCRLQRPKLILKSDGLGRVNGTNFQYVARHHHMWIAEVAAVIVQALGHVAEHGTPSVRRRSIGTERYGLPKVTPPNATQLGRGTAV